MHFDIFISMQWNTDTLYLYLLIVIVTHSTLWVVIWIPIFIDSQRFPTNTKLIHFDQSTKEQLQSLGICIRSGMHFKQYNYDGLSRFFSDEFKCHFYKHFSIRHFITYKSNWRKMFPKSILVPKANIICQTVNHWDDQNIRILLFRRSISRHAD